MPLKIVSGEVRLGRVAVTLADSAPNFDGTYAQASGNTGIISTTIDAISADFDGVFDISPSRTGTISVTLESNPTLFLGAGLTAPSWLTVPDVSFADGVASNFSVSTYLVDPDTLVDFTAVLTGTPPSGVIYSDSNLRYEYDGTGAIASVSGVVLTAAFNQTPAWTNGPIA